STNGCRIREQPFSQYDQHPFARGELAIQAVELLAALSAERAGNAQIVAVLARALLDLSRIDRPRMLLHDANHDAAKVIAASAHDLQRELARELHESVVHDRATSKAIRFTTPRCPRASRASHASARSCAANAVQACRRRLRARRFASPASHRASPRISKPRRPHAAHRGAASAL